jgi:23S rRNA (guanosine2251-2'-O)-methyltransferase
MKRQSKPYSTRRTGVKQRPRPDSTPESDGPIRLYGLHAVEFALRNPARQIERVLATENAARRLAEPLAARDLTPDPASPRDLDRLLGADTVHQGVMLETSPLPEPTLEDLLQGSASGSPLVVLDHVTDPHNVGAILRSAAVFGASGLIMTRRHSPPLNGALAKSASGALDMVPVLQVQNLARTLTDLKELGFEVIGLDGDADRRLEDEPFSGSIAIVLGAEGKGMRELTGETCNRRVRISAAGTLASLNVSNAAAIALHAAAVKRESPAREPS